MLNDLQEYLNESREAVLRAAEPLEVALALSQLTEARMLAVLVGLE